MDPENQFIDQKNHFIDPKNQFVDPKNQFIDPKIQFVDPKIQFVDPKMGKYYREEEIRDRTIDMVTKQLEGLLFQGCYRDLTGLIITGNSIWDATKNIQDGWEITWMIDQMP